MSICVQSIGFVTAKLKKAVRSPREAREKDFGVKLDGVGKAFCVLYGTTDKAEDYRTRSLGKHTARLPRCGGPAV